MLQQILRVKAVVHSYYLVVTWKSASVNDPREGWMIQPCSRERVGHRGRHSNWHYERSIAGPFRTKKLANEMKKHLQSIDWQRSLNWVSSWGDER